MLASEEMGKHSRREEAKQLARVVDDFILERTEYFQTKYEEIGLYKLFDGNRKHMEKAADLVGALMAEFQTFMMAVQNNIAKIDYEYRYGEGVSKATRDRLVKTFDRIGFFANNMTNLLRATNQNILFFLDRKY